jgi:hypothetical protein
VHIVVGVAVGDEEKLAALALRREWEAWRDARERELEARYRADVAARDALEAAAVEVRLRLTEKLGGLLEALEPYVDGTMGEVTAAMASVYVKAVHETASLYPVARTRPVGVAPMRVEPPVVEDPLLVEERRVAAVAAAREEILVSLAAVRGRMLPSAPSRAS